MQALFAVIAVAYIIGICICVFADVEIGERRRLRRQVQKLSATQEDEGKEVRP